MGVLWAVALCGGLISDVSASGDAARVDDVGWAEEFAHVALSWVGGAGPERLEVAVTGPDRYLVALPVKDDSPAPWSGFDVSVSGGTLVGFSDVSGAFDHASWDGSSGRVWEGSGFPIGPGWMYDSARPVAEFTTSGAGTVTLDFAPEGPDPPSVPEPATWAAAAMGSLLALAAARRRVGR